MKKIITVLVATFALAGVLAGCSAPGSLALETIEETGAYKVTAENATDSVEALEGDITLAEDTTFMVSPFLEKGELKVVLKDKATGEQVFEQVVDGKILDYYDVAPGDYALEVSAPSGATTGTCVIFAIESDLLEAQDAGLEEALEINGVDPSVIQK